VNILKCCFVPIVISLAAVLSLRGEVQDDIVPKKMSTAALPGPILAIRLRAQGDTGLQYRTTDMFGNLLQAPLQETRSAFPPIVIRPVQRSPETGKPNAMTMLSISCYQQSQSRATQTLSIQCRTEGYISNAALGDRIVMKGVITKDVASADKILIAAGSKVAGIAHIDPDSGRLDSKGNWSIIADNREVRVHAEVQDADTGFHGIQGKETSCESESLQRQAVVRDGRYCFLPDKTPFVLSIAGEVNITVLQPLKSSE
jgi:hypothetical protein